MAVKVEPLEIPSMNFNEEKETTENQNKGKKKKATPMDIPTMNFEKEK